MKNIDVTEIAFRLQSIRNPLETEEIEKMINEEINGRAINQQNMVAEIIYIVGKIIGRARTQDRIFMTDLIQTVVDELQKMD